MTPPSQIGASQEPSFRLVYKYFLQTWAFGEFAIREIRGYRPLNAVRGGIYIATDPMPIQTPNVISTNRLMVRRLCYNR